MEEESREGFAEFCPDLKARKNPYFIRVYGLNWMLLDS
jgi:hypothetical protein